MRIEPPIEIRRRRPNPFSKLLFYAAFLLICAALGFGVLMLIPVPQPSYKLTKVEGAEIYPAHLKTWRPVQTGEEIKAGDRIRTYKIGWVDLAAPELALRLIGGSELEIPRLYLWDRRPRFHLLKGYVYAMAADPGVSIAAGHIAPEIFKSPFFASLNLLSFGGKFAAGFDPSRGHARIYALENTLHIKSWFPRKELSLFESRTVEIFTNPFSSEITDLEKSELTRLQDSLQKITLFHTAPEPQAPPAAAEPQKISLPAPSQTQAASSAPGSWDLNSFSLYKTKSSQAVWTGGQFQYQVPTPESIAGITFNHAEVDASKFKLLKIQLRPSAGLPCPENLRIEVKSSEKVLRVFTVKLTGADQELSFPLRLPASSLLSEVSLLVTHAKAGAAKEGGFQISHLSFS